MRVRSRAARKARRGRSKTATKESWLIQVQFADKTMMTCTLAAFRRKLKGTGVEVDTTYQPVRVAPGRFVGRGTATKRVSRMLSGEGFYLSGAGPRDVTLFEDVKAPE